tara:strand:- start:1420 stop:1671 length:252 start_codon:yes stop_codon:yes gene_type:complete|mmetsp:Transcript_3257/g.14129  ORF Transcript_3257/g.14129 Transcript_3257/m.14129 type:complete len:84 (-) Transcript_3257:12830-13081(-)
MSNVYEKCATAHFSIDEWRLFKRPRSQQASEIDVSAKRLWANPISWHSAASCSMREGREETSLAIVSSARKGSSRVIKSFLSS